MTPAVKSVKALKNYKLEVEFSDGRIAKLDVGEFLDFGLFKKLKNIEEFNDVFVAFDTIQWRNGLDLDPEFIYNKSV